MDEATSVIALSLSGSPDGLADVREVVYRALDIKGKHCEAMGQKDCCFLAHLEFQPPDVGLITTTIRSSVGEWSDTTQVQFRGGQAIKQVRSFDLRGRRMLLGESQMVKTI